MLLTNVTFHGSVELLNHWSQISGVAVVLQPSVIPAGFFLSHPVINIADTYFLVL